MRSAFMEAVGNIYFTERPEPMISEDHDVKIKVIVTGICGSEIHAFHGNHLLRVPPVVSGHEYSGVVVEVGKAVQTVKVGDRVTSEPHEGCGECAFCQKGLYHICKNKRILGCGDWSGSFGEYIVVPEKTVIKLDETITFEEGAWIEPLAVGMHALKECSVGKGKTILIMGGGPIGLCIALCASLLETDQIIVADRNAHKLTVAKTCGATDTINTRDEDLASRVMDLTNGNGVDVSLLTFIDEPSLDQVIDSTMSGGCISEVALVNRKIPLDIGKIQRKELILRGSNMYVMQDFKDVCAGIAQGKLHVSPDLYKVLPVEECKKAMEMADKKTDHAIKIMMRF